MSEDDLERLSRRAEQLGRAVEAARSRETTATSTDGQVTATAGGGRLVAVSLLPSAAGQGSAAATHRDLVESIREVASTALQQSNQVMQEAAEAMTADLLARPTDGDTP